MAKEPLEPEKGRAARQPELERPRKKPEVQHPGAKPEIERPDTDPRNSHEGATENQVAPTTPPVGPAFDDEPKQG
jgi:hypothetical protein